MTITQAPPETGQAATDRGRYVVLLRTIATLIAEYDALPEPRVSPGRLVFWFTSIYDADLREKTVALARYVLGAAFGAEFGPHPLSDGWRHWEALRARPADGPVIDLVVAAVEAGPQDARKPVAA